MQVSLVIVEHDIDVALGLFDVKELIDIVVVQDKFKVKVVVGGNYIILDDKMTLLKDMSESELKGVLYRLNRIVGNRLGFVSSELKLKDGYENS